MFADDSPAVPGLLVTVIVAEPPDKSGKSLKISTNPCVAKLQLDKSNDIVMFDDSNVCKEYA